jgi:glycosyltransferase involved in cell wall biosynthesis
VWFSQTLGPRRGLDDLCAALPLLRGDWRVEIRARAPAGAVAWFRAMVRPDLLPRVHIEPVVPPDELSAVIAAHDVGLALEGQTWRSRDVTITNKVFEYAQNGLRVAASATAGQREALAQVPGCGALYALGDPADLAAVLNAWIADRDALRAYRARLHRDANAAFAYEHQTDRIVASVEAALGRP